MRKSRQLKTRGRGLKRLSLSSDKKCKQCPSILLSNQQKTWLRLRSILTVTKSMWPIINNKKSRMFQKKRRKNQIKLCNKLKTNQEREKTRYCLALNSLKTIKKSNLANSIPKLILSTLFCIHIHDKNNRSKLISRFVLLIKVFHMDQL